MNSLKPIISRPGLLVMLLSIGWAVISIGCNDSPQREKKPDTAKILNSPLFRSITDSIRQFPGEAKLYLQRATALSQNNLHDIASADYKKAWELTGDENIALEYTSSLILSNKITEAVNLLQQGISKFPGNTEFNRRLAEVYVQTEQPALAMEQFDNIIQTDSSNFEAWFDKGGLLAKMGDTTAALDALERSFSILPINYSGMALANLYTARKDPRALEICDILLSQDSSGVQTEPLFMKGVYYSETGQATQAISQFDQCILHDWKMTDAYIEKGIILFETKKITEALKVFNMAATVSNTDADAYYWMGRCYESSGETDQAIINYERAVALDRSFIEAKKALKRLNG